jgi:hypothetical protein
MSIDAPGVLRHAADLLTGVADELLSCNATADGVWDDADLEAEFSDLENTSALLRVLADGIRAGGGPNISSDMSESDADA